MKKPELIAPAGDFERLKFAFLYGADAVYASTANFSMRTREIGFTYKSLADAIKYAHHIGKKVYITVNTFPHQIDINKFTLHAQKIIKLAPDAIIAADPGIIQYFLNHCKIPIHLSTQANTTNSLTTNFWKKSGVKRIVLARELSLRDIRHIHQKSKIPLEAFVHGAMCMAYSGRCQISNYLTGRDPNLGQCIQACRFKYKLFEVEEDQRQGEKFPIYEDKNGTYLFNSRDLCMIEHIPQLLASGVSSFKIEGRLKSIYYLAVVIRSYRQAIDLYFANPQKYKKLRQQFFGEIKKTASRGFTTGFYFSKPDNMTNNYQSQRELGEYQFVGVVKKYNKKNNLAHVQARNRLKSGSVIEIISPTKIIHYKLIKILYKNGMTKVVHAGYKFSFKIKTPLKENWLIRTRQNI